MSSWTGSKKQPQKTVAGHFHEGGRSMALIWFLRAWCGPTHGWWQQEKISIKHVSSPESRSQLSFFSQCPNHWMTGCCWAEETQLSYGCCVLKIRSSACSPAVPSSPFCHKWLASVYKQKQMLGTWGILHLKVRYWSPPGDQILLQAHIKHLDPRRKEKWPTQTKRSPKSSSSFFITHLTHSQRMPLGSCRKTKNIS